MLTVLFVDFIRISETPKKHGLLFSIMQESGEIETSQFVKAYKASIVLSGDIPELPSMTISNSGQLIYSIPVLEFNNFDTTDVNDPIHKYIRKEIGFVLHDLSICFEYE